MDAISMRLRSRATIIGGLHHFADAMTGKSEDADLHTASADTIDALVAALREARQAIPSDDYFGVKPKIDAALALARGGK